MLETLKGVSMHLFISITDALLRAGPNLGDLAESNHADETACLEGDCAYVHSQSDALGFAVALRLPLEAFRSGPTLRTRRFVGNVLRMVLRP